ncbi:recombinase family protein [Paraburkholderia sp. Ac-20336]|uniref:recombinase family protein n=1 Tax=Burkholderiaceae TaxID=119060 RepID=UPI001422705A|nr:MULTISPECIES: recombinase family protein [Burkholderiaceae]MBN3805508.1 recombinase family protein [Paraburkholderia sp. Ac-20336]NIF55584.1 recombinase family protein [Burkholderia sp. Ax-1724]
MRIGYARVSTQDQETHAQLDALHRAGVDVIHEEKRSGATLRRPVLEKILRNIRQGDTLVVYKLDRIARSLKNLLTVIEHLHDRGCDFESLTEKIDTNSPAGRLMLQMLGAFAEFERELIRERSMAGIQAARDRGIQLGRPRKLTKPEEEEAIRLWRTNRYNHTAIAKLYKVHRSTVTRAIDRWILDQQPKLL